MIPLAILMLGERIPFKEPTIIHLIRVNHGFRSKPPLIWEMRQIHALELFR